MLRVTLCRTVVPAAVAAASLVAATPGPAQETNVLLVIADDFGVEQLGLYGIGADVAPTPTIDDLAERGVTFTRAWAHPVCSPTRATIFTGRYPFRHGVGAAITVGPDQPELPDEEITLAEILEPAGIASGITGKWHLNTRADGGADGPAVAGWIYHAGTIAGAVTNYERWLATVNGDSALETTYATTHAVDEALGWIEAQPGRWFCTGAFHAPHTPLHAPPRDLHSYDLTGTSPLLDSDSHYEAMVEAMDTELGRLLGELETSGRLADTTVILLGDNGSSPIIAEPPVDPRRAKGTVYEGGVRVPFIVAGPDVVGPGRTDDALVGVVDLFATIADLLGVDARAAVPDEVTLDSVSFADRLALPDLPPARITLFTEVFVGDDPDAGRAAIRGPRYKLVVNGASAPYEFYDLASDPWETEDLLADGGVEGLTPRERAAASALHAEFRRLRAGE